MAKPATKRTRGAAAAATVALGGDLTIYRAAELRGELAQHIAAGASRFDLSGVTDFDSAGLQLLAAVRASASRAGRRAEFIDPAACVRDVCTLCGLSSWLAADPEAT